MWQWTRLPERTCLHLHGDDSLKFLQGLITQDVSQSRPGASWYGCLLSPQGKFLYDMLCYPSSDPNALLLDVEAVRAEALIALLRRYRLRAKVEIEPSPKHVIALWARHGEGDPGASPRSDMNVPHWHAALTEGDQILPDPRLAGSPLGSLMGWRGVVSAEALRWFEENVPQAHVNDYKDHRIRLGIPESPVDLVPERSIILEQGLHELQAVSWSKGCYMGQELMARTFHRGLIRKRLLIVTPVDLLSPALAPGEALYAPGGDMQVGDVRSVGTKAGLAMVRLEAVLPQLRQHGRAQLEWLGPDQQRRSVALTPPLWMDLEALEEHDALQG